MVRATACSNSSPASAISVGRPCVRLVACRGPDCFRVSPSLAGARRTRRAGSVSPQKPSGAHRTSQPALVPIRPRWELLRGPRRRSQARNGPWGSHARFHDGKPGCWARRQARQTSSLCGQSRPCRETWSNYWRQVRIVGLSSFVWWLLFWWSRPGLSGSGATVASYCFIRVPPAL